MTMEKIKSKLIVSIEIKGEESIREFFNKYILGDGAKNHLTEDLFDLELPIKRESEADGYFLNALVIFDLTENLNKIFDYNQKWKYKIIPHDDICNKFKIIGYESEYIPKFESEEPLKEN